MVLPPAIYFALCFVCFMVVLMNGRTVHAVDTPPVLPIDISESLQGEALTPISRCIRTLDEPLLPHNIHIIISNTKNMYNSSKEFTEIVEYYAELYGYNFHYIDPIKVLEKYAHPFKSHVRSHEGSVVFLKGLITLCKYLYC